MNKLETLLKSVDDISSKYKISYNISEKNVGSETRKFILFEDFASGIVSIVITINNEGVLNSILVKGLNPDIKKLANNADLSNTVLNLPINNYILMDEDKMIMSMLVLFKI